MRVLPARYHAQQYRQLHHVLRLWRLRAAAYSDPGYDARLESTRSQAVGRVPVEDVVPDWDERVAAARRRRAGG